MTFYLNQVEELEKEAQKIRSNEPAWVYLKTQGNVKMYHKPSPHFNGNIYKFVAELEFPYDVVYQVMVPPQSREERLKWDKSLRDFALLETITEEVAIGYLATPSALLGLVSSREFVDLYYFKTFEKDIMNPEYGAISWIFAKSVDHPSRPPSSDCVRGINFPGGFAVAQNKKDPSKSFLEMYVNTDVGGALPRKVVEAALPGQQVSYVDSIKAEVARRCASK